MLTRRLLSEGGYEGSYGAPIGFLWGSHGDPTVLLWGFVGLLWGSRCILMHLPCARSFGQAPACHEFALINQSGWRFSAYITHMPSGSLACMLKVTHSEWVTFMTEVADAKWVTFSCTRGLDARPVGHFSGSLCGSLVCVTQVGHLHASNGQDAMVLWLYCGCTVAVLWLYCGCTVAVLWLYYGCTMAALWLCRSMSYKIKN